MKLVSGYTFVPFDVNVPLTSRFASAGPNLSITARPSWWNIIT